MTHCQHHPVIELPPNLTCPLCAQEARQRAYAVQRAETAARMPTGFQPLPRPATEVSDP